MYILLGENEEFVEINFIETALERIYIRWGDKVCGREFHMGTTLLAKKNLWVFVLVNGTESLNGWPRRLPVFNFEEQIWGR